MIFFRRKKTADADGFYTVAAADQVQPDVMTPVQVNGRALILTRRKGEAIAFAARCPHAAADLGKGELHRGQIICPDHGYKFDVDNGRLRWPPDEPYRLTRYPVKEEDGVIKVQVKRKT